MIRAPRGLRHQPVGGKVIEIEKAIADHPAVTEAAVVAAPGPKWREVPKAYVGLKPGMTATAEELIAWCRKGLAHFKCPKEIEFGPLPRTATGKVRKNKLRARAQARPAPGTLQAGR